MSCHPGQLVESLEFSVEIQHSSHWPGPIRWGALSGAQQARVSKAYVHLKSCVSRQPQVCGVGERLQ